MIDQATKEPTMTEPKEALKPCPFCGGQGEMLNKHWTGRDHWCGFCDGVGVGSVTEIAVPFWTGAVQPKPNHSHSQEPTMTKREKQIVAWLRKNAPQWLPSRALYSAADAIERGEPWKDSRP